MQFKKIILLFLAITTMGNTTMAASDELEYYRSFFANYRHPFGVKDRTTKEEAEKQKTYVIAKRDEAKRITSIIKVLEGKCFFHFEYTYEKNGKLASFKNMNCPEQPILEYLKNSSAAPQESKGNSQESKGNTT